MLQPIDVKNIQQLFKKYEVQWIVNIGHTDSKDMEYNPLYDELSYDSSENISTTLTVIQDHKKAVYSIDGYSLEKLENAFQEIQKIIAFAQYDTDIQVAEIVDCVEKDFWNRVLETVGFDFFEKQFESVKNYSYHKNIKIEWFSIWVQNSTHHFINSLWSVKMQKDNIMHAALVLFWEKDGKSEAEWKSFSSKNLLEITPENISEVQQMILDKLDAHTNNQSSQVCDIVLDREVVIGFLEVILDNLWAESIREGLSMFSKKQLGDQLFSPLFTLINDPNLAWYTGTLLFDKEWVTAKRTVLFDEWKWIGKFYDYKNALKEGIQYLGNSRVSNIDFLSKPTSNFWVGCSYHFMNLMAFHTIDVNTGKFSLAWEWYELDQNGKKTKYIKNISLTGDILELFSSISGVWDDAKTDGNFKVPSLSFSAQKVV